MYLLTMATRRLHNDGKVLSILIVNFENMSNCSSSDSDYIITDSKVSKSESRTSDGEPGQTLESSNWHEGTHFDPGPSKTILIQSIECETLLSSNFDWNTKPVEYFTSFLPTFIGRHPVGRVFRACSLPRELESQASLFQPWLISRHCLVLL
jgi:hypothetical protein